MPNLIHDLEYSTFRTFVIPAQPADKDCLSTIDYASMPKSMNAMRSEVFCGAAEQQKDETFLPVRGLKIRGLHRAAITCDGFLIFAMFLGVAEAPSGDRIQMAGSCLAED